MYVILHIVCHSTLSGSVHNEKLLKAKGGGPAFRSELPMLKRGQFLYNICVYQKSTWGSVIFTFSSGEMSFELIMIYAALMWEGAEPDTLI